LRPAQAKKATRPYHHRQAGHDGACLSSSNKGKHKIGSQSRLAWTKKLHLQNNQSKKGWRCGFGGRGPAKQAWNPQFKPQYHQKKKGIKKKNCQLELFFIE
jgi:hypothetical protein